MAERFDIYDEQGQWIGTATRAETHAKGLWHRSFHCWLARRGEDGRARILFQRRTATKDTNPGCYDITVAGHLSAGETVRDAAREMEEEIGFAVPFERLIPLGTFREEDSGVAGGVPYIDREESVVFGCLTVRALNAFQLQPEEVAGLYEADAEALLALVRGEVASVLARGVGLTKDGRLAPVEAEVSADAFVPRDPAYYIRCFEALNAMATSDLEAFDET
ncbi:NUDIX domain-containing protein [Cohnella sp. REN36]|uniref:NUDIX hydrolase n=1 Tax=Cohnella sp. REN36 TaxID=2887347 RepID=UPI001D142EF5|nr:NUDIX domain-containing protein [Cohnella sp. REN36]MCC3374756.1 NUDIX domain-containing protein [Cohnella sp. REN36]